MSTAVAMAGVTAAASTSTFLDSPPPFSKFSKRARGGLRDAFPALAWGQPAPQTRLRPETASTASPRSPRQDVRLLPGPGGHGGAAGKGGRPGMRGRGGVEGCYAVETMPRLRSPTSTASPTARQDATKRLEDPSSQHLSLTCCPARHKESFTASRDFSHVFCVMKGDSSCYESCAQEVWHARRLSQEACIAVAPEC